MPNFRFGSVGGVPSGDYEDEEIARRLKFADSLVSDAISDNTGKMVGPHYVAKNPWINAIQGLAGGYLGRKAEMRKAELDTTREQMFQDALRQRPEMYTSEEVAGPPNPATGAYPTQQVMKPYEQQQQELVDWSTKMGEINHPLAKAIAARGIEGAFDIPVKGMERSERAETARQAALEKTMEAARVRQEKAAADAAAAKKALEDKEYLTRLAASLRPPREPQQPKTVETANGVLQWDGSKWSPIMIGDKPAMPKVPAGVGNAAAKATQAVVDKQRTMNEALYNIDIIAGTDDKPGLLDTATGSGIGKRIDDLAAEVGYGTEGAIAGGRIAPLADPILKMIPRFEGPQSDKDTASYKEAAGQLTDPTKPRSVRKAAAATLKEIMIRRKGQFTTKDAAANEVEAPTQSGAYADADKEARYQAYKRAHGL